MSIMRHHRPRASKTKAWRDLLPPGTQDLVERRFTSPVPNRLLVADFMALDT